MIGPTVHWVDSPSPRVLAFGARPRSGEWLGDEIAGYHRLGIRHLVCLLEAHEVAELELQAEAALCAEQSIDFHALPIPDRGVPADQAAAHELFGRLAQWIRNGEPVYVHCRAGIGRSSLVAAAALVHLGIGPADGLDLLARSRGVAVPDTEDQRKWVEDYAARFGGRGEG